MHVYVHTRVTAHVIIVAREPKPMRLRGHTMVPSLETLVHARDRACARVHRHVPGHAHVY